MIAKFIEGANHSLGIQIIPDSDDERLLLRFFEQQVRPSNLLRIEGWGEGGDRPGCRFIRCYIVAATPEPTQEPQ